MESCVRSFEGGSVTHAADVRHVAHGQTDLAYKYL